MASLRSLEEWRRDLSSAEREMRGAKTVREVRAIQIRIRQIRGYIVTIECELT